MAASATAPNTTRPTVPVAKAVAVAAPAPAGVPDGPDCACAPEVNTIAADTAAKDFFKQLINTPNFCDKPTRKTPPVRTERTQNNVGKQPPSQPRTITLVQV
jgi:hypothetical protein